MTRHFANIYTGMVFFIDPIGIQVAKFGHFSVIVLQANIAAGTLWDITRDILHRAVILFLGRTREDQKYDDCDYNNYPRRLHLRNAKSLIAP